MTQINPFKDSIIVSEYRWLHNYAVLYQNTQAEREYFLDSNNLRCALTLLPTLPGEDGYLYVNEIFAKYAELYRCCESLFPCGQNIVKIEYRNRHASPRDGIVDSKKHEVILEYKEIEKSRRDETGVRFVIEGERLIKRAVDDRLMLKNIIYSGKSQLEKDGYVQKALAQNCACYLSNEGIMSALSSSKPVPSEIAVCVMPEYDLASALYGEYTSFLVTDSIENPDNLGLVIRTADACGADAVIVTGSGAAPYHKNCVRASRGALGRLPVFHFPDGEHIITELKSSGVTVIGTSAHAEYTVCNIEPQKKFAVVIGSESFGMSPAISKLCGMMLTIPMARGQSSFNVAVAAGIMLNRLAR